MSKNELLEYSGLEEEEPAADVERSGATGAGTPGDASGPASKPPKALPVADAVPGADKEDTFVANPSSSEDDAEAGPSDRGSAADVDADAESDSDDDIEAMDPRTWTDAECLRVASKFYYGGMALLPLLWVVNVVYFRHVVRRQNPPPDPKLVRIVRNSLGLAVLGLAVFLIWLTIYLSSWKNWGQAGRNISVYAPTLYDDP